VDGKDIKVEITETNHVRIPGAGMPRTSEGGNRGDLIVEVVRSQ
jgi:DnaJ-class molecular chaperone